MYTHTYSHTTRTLTCRQRSFTCLLHSVVHKIGPFGRSGERTGLFYYPHYVKTQGAMAMKSNGPIHIKAGMDLTHTTGRKMDCWLVFSLLTTGLQIFHDDLLQTSSSGKYVRLYSCLLWFYDAASPSDIISESSPCGWAKRWSCWFRKTKSCVGKYIRVFSPNKKHQYRC